MSWRCEDCGRVMVEWDGCTVSARADFFDGVERDRIRFGAESVGGRPPGRCHDCGARPGRFHHALCDVEECACCGGQALSCDCRPTPWGVES